MLRGAYPLPNVLLQAHDTTYQTTRDSLTVLAKSERPACIDGKSP